MFLVVANWKMNGTPALAQEFSLGVKPKAADVVVCAPFHLIGLLNGKFRRGAQNCHWDDSGAHTGEISAHMLSDIGATHVILGHSERRQAGETSAIVAKKAAAAQKAGLRLILCIGENEGEDLQKVLPQQIKESLPASTDGIVIAYEPVWAIGSGRTPTPDDIAKAHALIKHLTGIDVIYGGSVKPENTAEISSVKGVSGLLVGGASLDLESFNSIIEAI